jgi:hypothetical protein
MSERRQDLELLKLFEELERNFSQELFGTLRGRIVTMMATPNMDNFSELAKAHTLYPRTFGRIVESLNLPDNLTALLQLYLAMRRAGLNDWRLREILGETRAKAVRESNWSTLEEFATRGLTNEFATRTTAG